MTAKYTIQSLENRFGLFHIVFQITSPCTPFVPNRFHTCVRTFFGPIVYFVYIHILSLLVFFLVMGKHPVFFRIFVVSLIVSILSVVLMCTFANLLYFLKLCPFSLTLFYLSLVFAALLLEGVG